MMFNPEMKITTFEMVDVITTSVTCDTDCPAFECEFDMGGF